MPNMKLAENDYFYSEKFINFIQLEDYRNAIEYIIKLLELPISLEDKAFVFITSGYLNNKIGNYQLAIQDFTNAIEIEKNLEILVKRSKCIAYRGRSEAKYKYGDYKGSIQDKRKERDYRFIENEKLDTGKKLNYHTNLKNLTLIKPGDKEKILEKVINLIESKYDLIQDYKLLIDDSKKRKIARSLEERSEAKFNSCDYKGSIKAIRRAEKYI